MTTPEPTHLDARDPANADARDIREEVDREIDHYGEGLHDLVLLVPEDRWAEFLKLTGGDEADGACRYRDVMLEKGPVTAVVAKEAF